MARFPSNRRAPLQPSQSVEVITPIGSGATNLGTGYLIGPSLVLTARHVIHGARDGVTIRFGYDGDGVRYPVRVAWTAGASDLDLAVLQLVEPRDCQPVRFGVLPQGATQRLPYRSIGYPQFQTRTLDSLVSVRDGHELMGSLSPLTNPKTGLLELDRETRLNTTGASWQGFSGAPIFSHDLLVGVVARSVHEDGVLVAVPVSHMLPQARRARPEFTESPGRLGELHALLAADGIDVNPELIRRRPSYRDHVAEWFPTSAADRAAELDRLAAFALSGRKCQWWVTPPWYGKSTLAAHFFTHPPAGLDIVAFFVSRRLNQQDREFQHAVADQLAAICGTATPTGPDLYDLTELWRRTATHSAANDRALMLLLDGLDEAIDQRRVIDLIPAPSRVIVLSRPGIDLATPLRPDHPLTDIEHVTGMTQSRYASEFAERATQELDDVLVRDTHAPTTTVLALCAAAEGPLTQADLGELAGEHVPPAEALALPWISNALRVRAPRILQPTSDGFVFAHDQLRTAAVAALGKQAISRSRQAIHAWADHYAGQEWPESTPAYLCGPYAAMLRGDPDRLVALPASARTVRLRARTGSNAAALGEIVDASVAAAELGDVVAATMLALHRSDLLAPVRGLPQEIAVAWGAIAEWGHAEYLSTNLASAHARAWALGELAVLAQNAAESHRAENFLAAAAAMAVEPWRGKDYDVDLAADLVAALAEGNVSGASDLFAVAVDQAPYYNPEPDELSQSLSSKINAAARTGHPDLIHQAEGYVDLIPLPYIQGMSLARLAIATASQDTVQARQLVEKAEQVCTTDVPPEDQMQLLVSVAQACARAGDVDLVGALVDRTTHYPGRLVAAAVAAAAAAGRLDAAEQIAELTPDTLGSVDLLLSMADAAHDSDQDRARRYVDQARPAERATRQDQEPNHWSGQISWSYAASIARHYAHFGDLPQAVAVLDEIEDPEQADEAVVSVLQALADGAPELASSADDLVEVINGNRARVDACIALAEAAMAIGDDMRTWTRLERAARLCDQEAVDYKLIEVAAKAASAGTDAAFDFADRIAANHTNPYVRVSSMAEIAAAEAHAGHTARASATLRAARTAADEVDEHSRHHVINNLLRAAAQLPPESRAEHIWPLVDLREPDDRGDALGRAVDAAPDQAVFALQVLDRGPTPSPALLGRLAVAVAENRALFDAIYATVRDELNDYDNINLLVESANAATSPTRARELIHAAAQLAKSNKSDWSRIHAYAHVVETAATIEPELAHRLLATALAESSKPNLVSLALQLEPRAVRPVTAWLVNRDDIRYPEPASFD